MTRAASWLRWAQLTRAPRLAIVAFVLLAGLAVVNGRPPPEPPAASLPTASRFAESAAPFALRRTP